MSDRKLWNRANRFIQDFESGREPEVGLAVVVDENGVHEVEIDLDAAMQRIQFIMMPCSPTVH